MFKKYFHLIISGLFLSLDFYLLFFNFIIVTFLLILIMFNFFSKNLNNFIYIRFFLFSSIPINKIFQIKNILFILFLLIFFINFFSLFSHFYSIFSLINFSIIFSFSFWIGLILVNFNYFLKEITIHLTPLSTPLALISFIVIIELVSQIIRPLTLLVRLATNLTTGHLIMGLISFLRFLSFFRQIPFLLLEIIVALVQAYVFILLILLYSNE